jgi:hypothetical protein
MIYWTNWRSHSRRLLKRFWWDWRKYLMNNNKGVRGQPVVLVVDDDMAERLLIVETLLENLAVEEAAVDEIYSGETQP